MNLPVSEVARYLIEKIDPLAKARIVLQGFELPDQFGSTSELEFGDLEKARSLGLSMASVEMAKSFVKSALEDIFSEDSDLDDSEFCVTEEEAAVFIVAPSTSD